MLAISFWMNSCKSKSNEPTLRNKIDSSTQTTDSEFDQLPEDFKEFYFAFHRDSVFQMNSIFFPLEGLPDAADPEFIGNEKYFWSPDQWVFQHQIIKDDPKYKNTYLNVSNMIIEEKIIEKETGLTLIRRFAKTGSGWRLIYYAGMNKYSYKEQ